MAEKSIKEQLDDIPNIVRHVVKEEIDGNKDGKISVHEVGTYIGKMMNGEGFKVLLITLASLAFNYFYDYALSHWFIVNDGSPLNLVGGLVFAGIITYAYKNVMGKVESSYGGVLEKKEQTIEDLLAKVNELKDQKQAQNLAIKLLEHDCEKYEQELSRLRK